MSRHFKYVIIDECYPRLCSQAEKHTDLAGNARATSAGEGDLGVDNGKVCVSCWGKSVSLGLVSNPDLDEHLIERMFQEAL